MAPCHAARPLHDPQPTEELILMNNAYWWPEELRQESHNVRSDRAEAYQF